MCVPFVLLVEESYFGGYELIFLATSQAQLYVVTDIELIESDAVEATIVEECVLTRAHIDEAEASLEGVDSPTHESIVELLA